MTTEHEASRTLVKSPPELWAECSDASSLARHLGEFGEITITRLEPESTVAWEGERVSGTVRIEPSAWGTRVTLTAETKPEPADAEIAEAPTPVEAGGEGDAEKTVAVTEDQAGSGEEEADAQVEETLEDPDPVADTGRARARWRRITARMRGFFGAGEPPDEVDERASVDPEEPEEPAESVPPPETCGPVAAEVEEPPVLPAAELGAGPLEPELDAEAVLTSALDSLGQAHHRPFSRA